MIITAWRLVKTRYLARAFDGEGARRYGGRWNRPGVPVVYVAESLALAALEVLVHTQNRHMLSAYSAVPVRFDEKLVHALPSSALPEGWAASPLQVAAQALGDAWVEAGKTAVLSVPSAVVEAERIFLLNPAHPAFRRIHIGKPKPFAFDERLGHHGP